MNLRHLYFDIVSTVSPLSPLRDALRQDALRRCPPYGVPRTVEDFDIRISCFDDLSSTPVENPRQIDLFMQNEPKYPHFSPKNKDCDKKRTQTNPILYLAESKDGQKIIYSQGNINLRNKAKQKSHFIKCSAKYFLIKSSMRQ